jgi:hypothetical protein
MVFEKQRFDDGKFFFIKAGGSMLTTRGVLLVESLLSKNFPMFLFLLSFLDVCIIGVRSSALVFLFFSFY